MHFGDRPAMCGLEVVKWRGANLGKDIDPAATKMIKHGYVDDGIGGRNKLTVSK